MDSKIKPSITSGFGNKRGSQGIYKKIYKMVMKKLGYKYTDYRCMYKIKPDYEMTKVEFIDKFMPDSLEI